MRKVIAIFGVGTGLGMSTARRFGQEGYKVALVSRDKRKLDGFASELEAEGIEAAAFRGDLFQVEGVGPLVQTVRDRFGQIDVVVHNPTATATGFNAAKGLTASGLAAPLSLLLLSLVEIVQAVLPEMIARGDGAILATHGIAAVRALPNLSGPSTATAAARNYLHCLNAELSSAGIYAGNLVVGGFIARGQRYRTTEDTAASTKIPTGMVVPTFEPDDLAEIYWDMVTKRSTAETIPTAPQAAP